MSPHHAPVPNVLTMIEQLLKAGEENTKLSEVEGYAPGMIPHNKVLDDHKDIRLKLTLLHLAAWTGDLSTIQDLMSGGFEDPDFDVNAKTEGGFTALHLTAFRGHGEALQNLLESPKVDVEANSSEGFTALHLAAYGDHSDCVRALLQKCPGYAHINGKDNVMGRTALHWAVCRSSRSGRKVFDMLLNNVELETYPRDKAGFTPLHFAAINAGDGSKHPDVDDKNLQLDVSLSAPNPPQQSMTEILVAKHMDSYALPINAEVGNVELFLSMPDVKDFGTKPWRRLCPIDIKVAHACAGAPKFERRGTGDLASEADLFRSLDRSMSGYTALHFASSQNNAALVTDLLRCEKITTNVPDLTYGMTPLHCSLRRGALNAFAELMSSHKVDISARLVRAGHFEHQAWLPSDPTLVSLDEFFSDGIHQVEFHPGEFRALETPLHFGIRFCHPKNFLEMIMIFLKHPEIHLALAAHNDGGTLPLQLAWLRSANMLLNSPSTPAAGFRFPELFRVLFQIFSPDRRANMNHVEDIGIEASETRDFALALDMLEGHEGNERLISKISRVMMTTQQSVNAVLVTATLVGSVTFSALLQPPLGVANQYSKIAARFFWTFDSLSFYFATFTILRCLGTTAISTPISYRFVGDLESRLAYEQSRFSLPLISCVFLGVVAFVSLGMSNVPPETTMQLVACSSFGLYFAFMQALRTLASLFSSYMTYLEQRMMPQLRAGQFVVAYFARTLLSLSISPIVDPVALVIYCIHAFRAGWTRKRLQTLAKGMDRVFIALAVYGYLFLFIYVCSYAFI